MSRIGAAWSIGASSVRNVPLGATVRLVGLGIGSGNLDPGNHTLFGEYAPYSSAGLAVTACAGAIRIESCTIAGSNGLSLSGCADVLVDRSSLSASVSAPAAIGVTGSKLTLTASSVHGCKGSPGVGGSPGPFGSFYCGTCVMAGPSGPAIVVNGAGAEVRTSGSQITGGHAGVHHQCYQCDGYPASGVITDALGVLYARDTLIESGWNEYTQQTTIPYVGNVVLLPEPHRGLECPPLADVDGIVTPLVSGAPGEAAWLVVSENTGRRALVPAAGVVHFAPPYVEPRLFLGVFDASGELLPPIQLPVPAGDAVAEYTLQLATSGVYGTRLGAAVSVLVLGPDVPIAPLGASIHVDPLGHDGRSGRTWSTSVASVQNALERALGDLRVGPLRHRRLRSGEDTTLRAHELSRAGQPSDVTGRVPPGLDVDLDGRPRVVDDPAVPDTGIGGPPVVDRGAYER